MPEAELGPAAQAWEITDNADLIRCPAHPWAIHRPSVARDDPSGIAAEQHHQGAITVQVMRMCLVVAILSRVAPVALAHRDSADHQRVRLDQVFREILLDRKWRTISQPHEHQSSPLLDRIRLDCHLVANGGLRAVGQCGAQDARVQLVGPAVVTAAPGARELLPAHRQRNATVQALVVQRVDLALLATKHDAIPQELNGDGPAADPARPGNWIPVVAEAERGRVIVRPGAEVALPHLNA